MWRWPWPGLGVGSAGAPGIQPAVLTWVVNDSVAGSTPPVVVSTAVTGTNDPAPVVPNLPLMQFQSQKVQDLRRDLNTLARKASLAGTENPHWVQRHLREIVVLSTSGLTTDSAKTLLPANSLISHVTVRVTVDVTGATSLDIGDASDPDRFHAAQTTLTKGTGWVCLRHHSIGSQAQTTDASLRVTADSLPSAGALEIVTWFTQFRVPDLPVDVVVAPAPPGGTSANGGLRFPWPWRLG